MRINNSKKDQMEQSRTQKNKSTFQKDDSWLNLKGKERVEAGGLKKPQLQKKQAENDGKAMLFLLSVVFASILGRVWQVLIFYKQEKFERSLFISQQLKIVKAKGCMLLFLLISNIHFCFHRQFRPQPSSPLKFENSLPHKYIPILCSLVLSFVVVGGSVVVARQMAVYIMDLSHRLSGNDQCYIFNIMDLTEALHFGLFGECEKQGKSEDGRDGMMRCGVVVWKMTEKTLFTVSFLQTWLRKSVSHQPELIKMRRRKKD